MEELTLTRFLWKSTSGVARITLTLFIITLVVGGFTVADADPIYQAQSVDAGRTKSFDLGTLPSSGQLQFGVFPFDSTSYDEEYNPINLDKVQVRIIGPGGVVMDWKTVYEGYGAELNVESGKYTIEVNNAEDFRVDLNIVSAHADMDLVMIFAIFVSALAIMISILSMLVPALCAVLIFNALDRSTRGASKSPVNGGPVRNTTLTGGPKNSRIMSDPHSYKLDVTPTDAIILTISVFILILMPVTQGFSVFAIVFGLLTLFKVIRNHRIRTRSLVVIQNRHQVSLNELAVAVGEKPEHVVKVVERMVLDLGYPITYERTTGMITKMADLSPYLATFIDSMGVNAPGVVVTPEKVQPSAPATPAEVSMVTPAETPSEPVNPVKALGRIDCPGCGISVRADGAFCHNCGQKLM